MGDPFDAEFDYYPSDREADALVTRARARLAAMTPEERARVQAEWDARSEAEKDDIRAEVEWDLI